METTVAFVLGMSVAVVIALAIVAVIGFVKAIKTEKALNEQMKDVYREMDMRITNIERMVNEITIQIHRTIDDKAQENEKTIENIHRRIDDVLNQIEIKEEHSHKRMDDILSQMDSRFDKMITKFDKTNDDIETVLVSINKKVEKIILKD